MITSYNELPLGKYLRINEVVQDNGSEDIDKLVSIIAILNDKSEDEVLTMPITDFARYSEACQFLFKNKQPKYAGRITDKVVMAGQTFRVTSGINELTTAQYLDFQEFAKEPQKHLVELISVFLIPEGKKYNDGYDVLEVQRIIRDNLSAPHATAIVDFFLRRLANYVRATLIYLAWKMRARKKNKRNKGILKTIKEAQTHFHTNGVGRAV